MQSKTLIVAEIAQGFEGNFTQALLLLKASAAAGAHAAKYQLVYADELATPDYKYYNLFKTLEMQDAEWQSLADHASQLNIDMYVDIFGSKSLLLAEKIGLKGVKLHGTDIANIGLLNEVAASSIAQVFLGAGGAHLSEIKLALDILHNKEVTVILGYQGYPTLTETNHINRIIVLRDQLSAKYSNFVIGFADHADPTTPLRYALASTAIGAGAQMIEKHITLGQVMKMEDHESALNPDEFAEFTTVIKSCSAALGDIQPGNDFGMTDPETNYRNMIRRHVVASRDLTKADTILPADITLKRTSAEEVITDLNLVYEKKLHRDISFNTAISLSDIN